MDTHDLLTAPAVLPPATAARSMNFGRFTPSTAQAAWLSHVYIARGMATLFTSRWKLGKSPLVPLLLSWMEKGGQLAGLEVQPARARIVSEEHPQMWAMRQHKAPMGGNI